MNSIFKPELRVPDYRLIVNGKDLSAAISNRLLSLTLTDSRGLQSDMLQLELQDATNDLEIPPLNATIQLALGWKGEPLVDKGSYTVSELEYSGVPNKLMLTATSADLRATNKYGLGANKSRSFHDTTIVELVEQIAKEHGLKSSITAGLKGIRIKHIDQTSESDIALLTRLGETYNAVVNVKHGTLLFISIGKGISASGKQLPTASININECTAFSYREITRDAYTGIVVYWNDISGAKRHKVIIGTTERAKELKQTFATEEDACRGAEAELERLARASKTITFQLAEGRPEIEAETPLHISGIKRELQSAQWITTSIILNLGDQGFNSVIEAEKSS